jgi:hypothetical protein
MKSNTHNIIIFFSFISEEVVKPPKAAAVNRGRGKENQETAPVSHKFSPIDYTKPENWSVLKFIDHKKNEKKDGDFFLKARWKGYDKSGDTWEPLGGVNSRKYPNLLAEYASFNKDIQKAAMNLKLLHLDPLKKGKLMVNACCAGDKCSVSNWESEVCDATCKKCKKKCHAQWCCKISKSGLNLCTLCSIAEAVKNN